MSPTMPTVSPSSRPTSWRMVKRSSSACVGCWCIPSPPLITCASMDSASTCGAPGVLVTHHDQVTRHRRECLGRIAQRLALHGGRGGPAHVDGISRETLGRDLEGCARPRARLQEQVDDGATAQRRQLLDATLVDLLERLGGVEDQIDVLGSEIVHRDDVAR